MKVKKKILMLVICATTMLSSVGCAQLNDFLGKVKGSLVGQKFDISMYDDSGTKTLEVSGNKVTVGLMENSANFNVEDTTGFKSEVLDITINGKQMLQVGNTCIFEEEGLNMVTDFEVPEKVQTSNGGGFVPLDRLVNHYKNKIGKSKVVIVSSQEGLPIGVYQGDDIYVTIPSDLPKMTRLNIDGKSLYIHRANYTILDKDLIK